MTDQSRDTHDDDTEGDTSGHRFFSDRTVKENVEPVSHDEDDDTAGHGRWNP